MSRASSPGAFVAIACAAAVCVAACSGRVVDLGGAPSDAGALEGEAAAQADAYGCVDLTDAQVSALRGDTCLSTCDEAAAGVRYQVATRADAVAQMAGRWMFCGAHPFGPADVVGIELAPGCRVFLLRRDDTQQLVRGTEAAYQANYDLYDPHPGSPTRLDMHVGLVDTIPFELRVTRCPHSGLTFVAQDGTSFLMRPPSAGDFVDPPR